MARDLRLTIQGDSSSADKAFASASAALEKAQRELKQAEGRTDALAVKARKLAEAEERAADKTRDLAAKTAAMRKQIEESGDATGALSRKLDRLTRDTKFAAEATDDYRRAADRAAENAREQARAYDKVADNARQAARAVALLDAASKLGGRGRGRGGAGNVAGGFFGGLQKFGSGVLEGGFGGASSALEGSLGTPVLGPALLALGAAAAVPASMFIGGAAGGGVLAGLGAGGAGLGLAGAWQTNPDKYAQKWEAATDRIKKRWLDSSSAFGNELDMVLKVADRTLQNLPVEKVLALSQSFVAPLAEGASQGLTGIASGIADSLERVQPVVDKLGPALGNFGHDVGDAFRAISLGSEGGADALADFVNLAGYAVKALGVLILGFEDGYEHLRDFALGVNDVATTLPGVGLAIFSTERSLFGLNGTTIQVARTLDDTSRLAHRTAWDWGEMGEAAAAAALQTIDLNDALTKNREVMLASANANIAVAQGWIDLNEELKQGAATLDLNTQEGVDNEKQIISMISALEAQRQQAIATGGGTQQAVDAANAAYDAQVEKLRQAAYAAGLNKQQVDDLIASLGNVHDVKANVQVSGLSQALGQGISLGNALNNIDGFVAHATVSFSAIGSWVLDAARNAGAHARGGTMPTSGPKMVGEHGTELIWGSRGQYVSTAEETRKLMSMAGSATSGGGSSGPLQVQVMPGADPYVGALVQTLYDRGYIQTFAGSQPVTSRRG